MNTGSLHDDRNKPTQNASQPKTKPLYSLPVQERTQLIQQAYKQTLGREPTNVELSRYKFSSLTYYQLLETLITSQEHTKALAQGKHTDALNLKNEHLLQEIEMLRNELDAKRNELKSLESLLQLKNQTISDLRRLIKQQQNLSDTLPSQQNINQKPPQKYSFDSVLKKFVKE